jgi:cytoskeletal protein RodZ
MSKHLRSQQRRAGGRTDAQGVIREEPSLDPSKVSESSAENAGQNSGGISGQAPAPGQAAQPFTADVRIRPEAESAPRSGQPFRNGDDPDKIPVAPELPDDQVPNLPGAILRHAREMLGLSQREVAAQLQLRVNTVSDIEHDRLNQPTAEPFVAEHLANYAALVNIDPKAVVSLYHQNVSRAAEAASRNAKTQAAPAGTSGSGALRFIILAAIVGVILAVGIFIGMRLSGPSESPEESSGALTLSPAAQQQVQEAAQNGQIPPLGPTADDQIPEPVPESAPEDANTLMARQQAQALGTNEIIAQAQKPEAEADKKQGGDDERLSVNGAAAAQAAAPKPAPAPAAQSAAAPQQSGQQTLTAAAKPQNSAAAKPEVKPQAQKQDEPRSKDESADAPASLGAVRTVSAKVVNRRDIGSLNSVSVKVRAPVYLRISGNGKILKQGQFKAGQTVTATGMPPLRIEVSDNSRITVSYNGGTVSAPQGKNIGYELPTR